MYGLNVSSFFHMVISLVLEKLSFNNISTFLTSRNNIRFLASHFILLGCHLIARLVLVISTIVFAIIVSGKGHHTYMFAKEITKHIAHRSIEMGKEAVG